LGEGGSLTCRQEGKLYINKELYVDGVKQEQGWKRQNLRSCWFYPWFC